MGVVAAVAVVGVAVGVPGVWPHGGTILHTAPSLSRVGPHVSCPPGARASNESLRRFHNYKKSPHN